MFVEFMANIDRKDQRILEEIQQNARISNLELADKVGLSPTPCLRRVKRLEEEGIIDRHVTLLDAEKLGLGDRLCWHFHGSPHP